jgi:hypothetical protein
MKMISKDQYVKQFMSYYYTKFKDLLETDPKAFKETTDHTITYSHDTINVLFEGSIALPEFNFPFKVEDLNMIHSFYIPETDLWYVHLFIRSGDKELSMVIHPPVRDILALYAFLSKYYEDKEP